MLKMEKISNSSNWDSLTLDMCKWLVHKTENILDHMITYTSPPLDLSAQNADGGWRKVYNLIYK